MFFPIVVQNEVIVIYNQSNHFDSLCNFNEIKNEMTFVNKSIRIRNNFIIINKLEFQLFFKIAISSWWWPARSITESTRKVKTTSKASPKLMMQRPT